ncbi:MAG: RNA methyltransferase [Bacteroidales bacterium]|jgi:TrmH family RNA methyltransferase|nr:RNA methyltransferase [Bacteroidales bacterium]MDD4215537.1 RNA methyltransferase [Bacteroidales bacterium]
MKSKHETITSVSNKRIKNIALLMRKQSERKAQRLMVVEGEKEIRQALNAGVVPDSVFICHKIATDQALVEQCTAACTAENLFFITKDVFAKVAYRDDSGGIILLAKTRYLQLDDITLPPNSLIVILENVEKPGNLGAVLRTCDAAGVDLLIICDPETDIYNPNVIRSGIGCIFTQRVVVCTSNEAIVWLKKNKITVYAAALQTNDFYHEADMTNPVALVFGTEASGLTEKWLHTADQIIKIPMLGTIDSLNVSNSVAIMVYEAKRQRGFA